MAPSAMTGRELVQESLPDLLKSGHSTNSPSTQNLYFNSTLGYWSHFEMNARQNFDRTRWNSAVLDYAPDERGNTRYHVYHEQLVRGDEHSVVARFNQNVGHVMTSVIRSSSIADIRFGDYKTVKSGAAPFNKVPDFAVIDSNANLLLMGEAKTPWAHNIETQLESPGQYDIFRKYLGQIAQYMYYTKRKFGFWTSYNETVFLKQEKHPTRKGRWVLWYSPVIKYNTSLRRVSNRDSSNPAAYRNNVSLRECFLYLISMANEEHEAINTMDLQDWVGQKLKAKKDDEISDESTGSSSEEDVRPSRSQADDRAARRTAREAKKSTTSVSDLEDRASRLTLHDRQQSQKQSQWEDVVVDVYYSNSRKKWYYKSERGKMEFVDAHELKHPRDDVKYWFSQNGKFYQARSRGRTE